MPIPALITGALGLGSAIAGSISSNKTNKTNMKIAQMNNQFSEKMMEKQHAYDMMMWQKNADYNSASAQAERLREAGLNPALIMSGSGAAGTASGGSSVGLPSPSTPSLKAPTYDGFVNALNNALQMSMAVEKNRAEVDSIVTNTDATKAMLRARLDEMYEETRSKRLKNEIDEISKEFTLGSNKESYLLATQTRVNAQAQQKLIEQNILTQQFINQGLPDKLAMEISVMASQRDLNEFNSSVSVGKFMDEIKKRGIKLNDSFEKIIFGTLLAARALK